jgi:hypothetical protein
MEYFFVHIDCTTALSHKFIIVVQFHYDFLKIICGFGELIKEKKDENMFFSCINELKAKIFLCMFLLLFFIFDYDRIELKASLPKFVI